ncbi:MAG TPA: hypothetical protein VGM33_25900 [Baekduia sp.]|jgi:hypothetical protein
MSRQAEAEREQLTEEQAALRRMAMLVADGTSPDMVQDAMTAELKRPLVADGVAVGRYESDEEVTVVAHRSLEPELAPVGTRLNYEGHNISAIVRRTGRPVQLEARSAAQRMVGSSTCWASWTACAGGNADRGGRQALGHDRGRLEQRRADARRH